jgi:hypothetical protein
MRAAIRPYSMAVAPDSSLAKREKRFFMGFTPGTTRFRLASSVVFPEIVDTAEYDEHLLLFG